jgi:hypothetical protein
MMAGRSVVRDDATAAVPSSQWRPSRLLDAEYPAELSRGPESSHDEEKVA